MFCNVLVNHNSAAEIYSPILPVHGNLSFQIIYIRELLLRAGEMKKLHPLLLAIKIRSVVAVVKIRLNPEEMSVDCRFGPYIRDTVVSLPPIRVRTK